MIKQRLPSFSTNNSTYKGISLTYLILFQLLVVLCVNQSNIEIPRASYSRENGHRNSINSGDFESLQTAEKRFLPRYYVCGAAMTTYTHKYVELSNCGAHHFCPSSLSCPCVAKEILAWSRSNNIKFQFCHLLNWNNQVTVTREKSTGWGYSWPELPMRFCPENSYAEGFKTKINEADGFTGLALSCRNLNSQNTTDIIIKEGGDGKWEPIQIPRLNQFISGFHVKFVTQATTWMSYMNGIEFQIQEPALISGISFSFVLPRTLESSIEIIEMQSITNSQRAGMREYTFTKNFTSGERFSNENGYLTGDELPPISGGFPVTRDLSGIGRGEFNFMREWQRTNIFKFGQELRSVSSAQRKVTTYLPACTTQTLKQFVRVVTFTVPYVATITYTTLTGKTAKEYTRGQYRAVVASPVYRQIIQFAVVGCVPPQDRDN